jgi:fatty acid desaturase
MPVSALRPYTGIVTDNRLDSTVVEATAETELIDLTRHGGTHGPGAPVRVVNLIEAETSPQPEHRVPADVRAWGTTAGIGTRSTMRGIQATGEPLVVLAAGVAAQQLIGGTVGTMLMAGAILLGLMRVQNLAHESAHRAVFSSRWANDVTLIIVGVIALYPAHTYRHYHFAHHRFTRIESKDPEAFYDRVGNRLRYLATLLFGGIIFTIAMWITWLTVLIGRPQPYAANQHARQEIRRWGTLNVVVLAVVIFLTSTVAPAVLAVWLISSALYAAGPYTAFTLFEHLNAETGARIVDSSGTIRSNRVVRWALLNGNLHAAHHTIPTASWWRLPQLEQAIQDWRSANGQPTPAVLQHSGYIRLHTKLWRSLPWW